MFIHRYIFTKVLTGKIFDFRRRYLRHELFVNQTSTFRNIKTKSGGKSMFAA